MTKTKTLNQALLQNLTIDLWLQIYLGPVVRGAISEVTIGRRTVRVLNPNGSGRTTILIVARCALNT
jgi:hypothetical protein